MWNAIYVVIYKILWLMCHILSKLIQNSFFFSKKVSLQVKCWVICEWSLSFIHQIGHHNASDDSLSDFISHLCSKFRNKIWYWIVRRYPTFFWHLGIKFFLKIIRIISNHFKYFKEFSKKIIDISIWHPSDE